MPDSSWDVLEIKVFILGGTRKKPVDRRLLSPLYLYIASLAKTQSPDNVEVCVFF